MSRNRPLLDVTCRWPRRCCLRLRRSPCGDARRGALPFSVTYGFFFLWTSSFPWASRASVRHAPAATGGRFAWDPKPGPLSTRVWSLLRETSDLFLGPRAQAGRTSDRRYKDRYLSGFRDASAISLACSRELFRSLPLLVAPVRPSRREGADAPSRPPPPQDW